jgi:hypothetical protein
MRMNVLNNEASFHHYETLLSYRPSGKIMCSGISAPSVGTL